MTGVAHPRWLTALVCSAQFMVVLDLTIVNVALPSLQDELGLSTGSLQWVVGAYAIAFGGFLIVGGRAADMLGRRRVLIVGALLFSAASLACGVAPSGGVLVGARAVQGLGAALLSPAAFGLLVASFPAGRERTSAIAAWGSIGSLGAVAGLGLGGVVTEILGWRAIFLLNVPFGVALVALAPVVLPISRARKRAPVDLGGAVLVTIGVAALAHLLSRGGELGWTSPASALAAIVAVAALSLFAWREGRVPNRLLPEGFLRDRRFLGASVVGLVYGSAMLGMLLLLAVYLQAGRGLSALEAGIVLLVLRAPAVGWARLVGRLVGRFGPQPLLVLGSVLLTGGLVSLVRVPFDGPLATGLVPSLVVLGLAIPCLFVSVNAVALGSVDPDRAALASGTLSTFQWLGGALGLAFVTAVAGEAGIGATASPEAVVESVRAGFIACSALGVLALAAALALVAASRPRPRAVPAPV